MTWFQVEFDGGLPQGLCTLCSESAIAAINFRQLCKESNNQWKQVTSIVDNIAPPSIEDATYYIFYSTDNPSNPTLKVVKKRPASVEPILVERKPAKMPRLLSSMQCPDCGKQFPSPVHLNSHLKNSVKRVCELCGLLFDKTKFPKHLHKAHNKIVYPCNSCHQIFEDEISLDLHLLKAHGNNSYECKVCGKGFTNERALTAHSYCHSLFLCTSCGRTFENRNCYMYHRHQCQPETPSSETNEYICDVCGNSYTKKPSLRIHIIQKHLNVLPYVCATCGKRTSTIAHLRSHEKVHTLHRSTFNCHCGAVMRTELGYQLHLRNHTGEKPYECDECGDKFLSASRRLDHIKRRHRPTKDMPHGCKECSARFVRPFELRKHYLSVHHMVMKINTNRNIEEEKYCPKGVCVTCATAAMAAQEFRVFVRNSQSMWHKAINALNEVPKSYGPSVKSLCSFVKPDNFQTHTVKDYTGGDSKQILNRLRTRLTKRKAEIEKKARTPRSGPACNCPDCGKHFFSPYFLRLHLKNSGFKEGCLHCGAVLARGNELKEHLSKVHGETLFLCKRCPMLFTSDIKLKKHSRKAHKPGAWTCNDCGRSFPSKNSLEMHSQMHTVRTCRACGAQFTNRGCYREHRALCEPNARPDRHSVPRNKRSNIRDPATFTCDYCGKTYLSRPQLKNHIIWIHMDVRPHQCQWCAKRFYTPSRLAEHSVVHTRERNFECDICGAKLVSKMAAVYHRRRHTGEKPYQCEDCGEGFISSSRRLEHAKRRHGRGQKIHCLQCPSTFVRKYELLKHMEKAHRTQGQNIEAINKEPVLENYEIVGI